MNGPNFNWEKIKGELSRLSNVEELKKELHKLMEEIRGFDIHAHLSPSAKQRLQEFEKRYNQLVAGINKAQRQFDREFNKVLRVMKRTKSDAEKTFRNAKKTAKDHQKKIQKVSASLKKKVKKKTLGKSASPRKKKTARDGASTSA